MHIIKEQMWNLIREMETIKKKKQNLKLKQYIPEMKNSEDRFEAD